MKSRKELVLFKENEKTEKLNILLDQLKEIAKFHDFETDIPCINKFQLLSLAMSICLITDEKVSKEGKITEFLDALSTIEELSYHLLLLMLDLEINEIFTNDENDNIIIKEEYIKKYNEELKEDEE